MNRHELFTRFFTPNANSEPVQTPEEIPSEGEVERPTQENKYTRFYERDTFSVHGKTIEFYGIRHENKRRGEYEKTLEDAIENSSAVILEYAPQASGIYDRESIARNLGNLRKWLRDETASVRQIYEALIQDRHLHFWYEIENLCARKGKRIITIDPDVIDHERMTALYDRNKDVDTLKLAALVGGVTGMVCSVLLRRKLQEKPGQQSANELSEQEIMTQDQPSTMPRREFLRKSLMATAGVSLGASVLSGLSEGASALNDAE